MECWNRLFAVDSPARSAASGPQTVKEVLALVERFRDSLTWDDDLQIQQRRGAFHVDRGGACNISALLPVVEKMASHWVLAGSYEDHLARLAEEHANRPGHYATMPAELETAREMRWYPFPAIEELAGKFKTTDYGYVSARKEAFEVLSGLIPVGAPLYDWDRRYPGNREKFVCSVLGPWPTLFARARALLEAREASNRTQATNHGRAATEPEIVTESVDLQKGTLSWSTLCKEIDLALLNKDGVFDRAEFERHHHMHWVTEPDNPDDPDEGGAPGGGGGGGPPGGGGGGADAAMRD
jgi:hypothetical protein